MAKTVVGLFDTNQEAQTVIQELVNNGFQRNDISLVANDANNQYSKQLTNHGNQAGNKGQQEAEAAGKGAVSGTVAGGALGLLVGLGALLIPGIGPVVAAGPIATVLGLGAAGAGVGAAAGGLLGALGKAGVPEEDAHYYAEGVRRGGSLVMVKTPDENAQQAYDIMQRAGAVDIDERSGQWKQEGWRRFDANGQPFNVRQEAVTTSRTNTPATNVNTRQMNEGEIALPVVQEEIVVGKREVQRGGARIFTHVVEQPVEQQVTLRDETIRVDRRPVDREVTQADLEAFKEGTIDITETDEEAVVGKTARVVEEIRIDKEVANRTETVRDNVRRTDVEVEQFDGQTLNRDNLQTRSETLRNNETLLDNQDRA